MKKNYSFPFTVRDSVSKMVLLPIRSKAINPSTETFKLLLPVLCSRQPRARDIVQSKQGRDQKKLLAACPKSLSNMYCTVNKKEASDVNGSEASERHIAACSV
ncbi:hypothetical protein ABW19_dt0206956 [Dactylella cylindrospora]|nr:hypothetical protein ABW19_dt0206956 [Dactylella cylindrospora]